MGDWCGGCGWSCGQVRGGPPCAEGSLLFALRCGCASSDDGGGTSISTRTRTISLPAWAKKARSCRWKKPLVGPGLISGKLAGGAAGTRANINLTPEKRTRIHEVIVGERNAPRVSSPNFDISIGTRVPRTVRFAALPRTIVEIEPTWRGFEYFMVGDQIVIVDPRSMEIVAVLEA